MSPPMSISRTGFSAGTKSRIAVATKSLCAVCMTSAKFGDACPIVDAANTMGAKMDAESRALQLDIADRNAYSNGVWLCNSCKQRMSFGRAMFCPPSQVIIMIMEAFNLNPSMNLRQVIQQPKVAPWLNYYLLVVPNVHVEAIDVFPTRRPGNYKFVDDIGFTKRDRSSPGETYLIYKTSDGPMASSAKVAVVDLARDEERFRRLWYIPQIDIVNVVMMALWNLKLADVEASSHCDVMRDLAHLHILLWQRRLTALALDREFSIVTDEDVQGDPDDNEEVIFSTFVNTANHSNDDVSAQLDTTQGDKSEEGTEDAQLLPSPRSFSKKIHDDCQYRQQRNKQTVYMGPFVNKQR
ncbi:hypothetical protein B0H16DRAFT_1729328 [Mycena metata]|uniref:Uncharacterized protein n=1 Tax=Mycena metata TaxID=1033252 RepID=A0AAD7MZU3_9AGAR|nr:hypothetical protein B0H16DRAFT_1729328 [Mycena metata]